MSDRIKVDQPVIVEGRYDKIRIASLIEGTVITTDGFGVFKNSEKKALIRRLASERGVIILTDSDGGGLVIRSYLNSVLPKDKIINLYIPAVKGREKRKKEDSKEGLLGVEGIDCDILRSVLAPFSSDKPVIRGGVTKADFYRDGLSGREGSAEKRKKLCRTAGLPENIGANALLEAVNLLYDRAGYEKLLASVDS